ncbi:MAG: four helix bundle protein [Candidatus Omnitrophota bacterium]
MHLNPKSETLNSKQIQNTNIQNSKPYNLGGRTLNFTKRVIGYINNLSKTLSNIEVGKQLIRSAGSIGANYIEAEEALSKKDFVMRIKISRKEAKETIYWLNLSESNNEQIREKEVLIQESTELMKIFGSIIKKSK